MTTTRSKRDTPSSKCAPAIEGTCVYPPAAQIFDGKSVIRPFAPSRAGHQLNVVFGTTWRTASITASESAPRRQSRTLSDVLAHPTSEENESQEGWFADAGLGIVVPA